MVATSWPTRAAKDVSEGSPVASPPIELSVVMPVYNEEQSICSVVDEAMETLERADFRGEIVLVNDASKDHSAELLEGYQKAHPDIVRVLHHETNKGITAACQTLYANARGKYVFINGSDGQWRTAECLRMMALRDQYDLIVGRRRRKQYDLRRKVVSSAFNVLPVVMFGTRTYDAGSIKLFRKEVLDIPVLSRGPFREAERIIRAADAGFRVGTIDVDHYNRNGGQASGARFSLIQQSVVDLARCWWELRAKRGFSLAN